MSGGIKLQWRDRNYAEDSHRIYRSDTPMSLSSMPTPIATLTNNVTEYIDYDVIEGNTYYYRIGAVRGNDEAISDELELIAEEPNFGPGPSDYLSGTSEIGFFGLVEQSILSLDTVDLATYIGLTQGTAHNTSTPYLKYSYQGRVIFIAQKTIRYGLATDHLIPLNAVYGDTEIILGDNTYKLRLMTGGNGDPSTAEGGEWDALIIPSSNGILANYTTMELNAGTNSNGSVTQCQEKLETPLSYSSYVNRGYNSIQGYGANISPTYSFNGWRPVLELIQ